MIIGICELYNPFIHGGYNSNLKYKYIVTWEIDLDEFYNNEFQQLLNNMHVAYSTFYSYQENDDYSNYRKIIRNNKYFTINVIDEEELETMELVGTLKTCYISIFQRKWRKIFNERNKIKKLRMNPKNIMYRKQFGKWPIHCAKYV